MVAIAEDKEQLKAQLEETKTKLQDAERERDKNKSELHDIREELERTQSQLDEVLGELEQTHFELHQLKEKPEVQKPEIDTSVKEELEQTKSQLQTSQAELAKTKSQLQETKEELERTYSQLDQIMGELEQSNFELHQLKEKGVTPGVPAASNKELEENKAVLEKCQRKLQGARNHLQQTQTQLATTQQELQKTKAVYSAHVTNTLVNILLPTVQVETLNVPAHARGSLHQRERLASVAEYCIKGWGGDLLEIGCFLGETTRKLAEVAKKYNRRIIALDPWELGTQNCQGGEYETFLKNIEPYKDVVDIIRLSSLDEKAIAMVKSRQLCFAYVDGLHTYDACLKDIETVAHCQSIIAVDDLLWCADVERAFQKGAEVIGRSKLHLPLCREGYLVPSA